MAHMIAFAARHKRTKRLLDQTREVNDQRGPVRQLIDSLHVLVLTNPAAVLALANFAQQLVDDECGAVQ